DHRPVPPPVPVADETVLLLLHDRLGGGDMLEAVLEGLLADPFQIVDVEKTGPIAVVDPRVEIARHGDVQDDDRAARPGYLDFFVALARDDRLGRPRGAE